MANAVTAAFQPNAFQSNAYQHAVQLLGGTLPGGRPWHWTKPRGWIPQTWQERKQAEAMAARTQARGLAAREAELAKWSREIRASQAEERERKRQRDAAQDLKLAMQTQAAQVANAQATAMGIQSMAQQMQARSIDSAAARGALQAQLDRKQKEDEEAVIIRMLLE